MNPLLQQTESAVLAKVNPPQLRPVVDKLVGAGKTIMFSDKTRHLLMDQMQGPGDDFEKIGSGIAKLIGMVVSQTKGTAPPQALIPAAVVLLCDALDFLEQAGRIKVTNDTLAQAMQEMSSSLLQLMGITPQKLQQMTAQAQKGGVAGGMTTAAAPAGIIGSAIGGA